MGFVYEVVPEEDRDFLKSMGLKDCWGTELKTITKRTKWCADREQNAYLIGIGGGYHDMPYFYDLWWNGHVIRMEVEEGGKGNVGVGMDIIWIINRIPISEDIWQHRGEVLKMIKDAFSVNRSWCELSELKSITVKIACEVEKVENK